MITGIVVKDKSAETESVCPVCLKKIAAKRMSRNDDVLLVKSCEDHGTFETVIWRGKPLMEEWQRPKAPAHVQVFYRDIQQGCPFDCGLCEAHQQIPCSVLLEVTDRCNLNCAVCFADARSANMYDLPMDKIQWLLEHAIAAAGPSNLQISGGEPTLRDDLPRIVRIARDVGYSFIQINTNGLRLSSDKDYIGRLVDAGLSSVFLQFDGVDDTVYEFLRGKPLFDTKLNTVANCGAQGLGVVLVPTLVRNVNTDSIGDIVRLALRLGPTVRGIHFQPVSYFGRFPGEANDRQRFTLPELMRSLEEQTGGLLKVSDFVPPGCEHAHCSFHSTYMNSANGELRPLGFETEGGCCTLDFDRGGVKQTVENVSRKWALPGRGSVFPVLPTAEDCCNQSQMHPPSYSHHDSTYPEPAKGTSAHASQRAAQEYGRPSHKDSVDLKRVEEDLDLDFLLRNVTNGSFTVSAMAFQDADNLDLERLRGCCISVIGHDGALIPFCAYNLTARDGRSLYRKRNDETK